MEGDVQLYEHYYITQPHTHNDRNSRSTYSLSFGDGNLKVCATKALRIEIVRILKLKT